MSRPVEYGPETDEAIRAMRLAGASWADVGRALGLAADAARQRARRAELCERKGQRRILLPEPRERDLAGHLPLPPFHPIAAAILANGMHMQSTCNE